MTRRAVVTALVVTTLAAAVHAPPLPASDAPFERERGGIPPADDGIVAALLRVGPPVRDPLVAVAGSNTLDCVNDVRRDGQPLTGRLAAHFAWYYQGPVFFLGSIDLGRSLVGLLFRAPGLFTSSVVDLWPYDAARRRWLTPVELADNWGDPDQWYLARAWLLDVDGDGYRDVVKREKIGAGGRMTDDRVSVRRLGPGGYGPPRADAALAPRFDFALACR